MDTGEPPISIVCAKGHKLVAQLLIDTGAAVNCGLDDGVTPPMGACQEGHLRVVRLLLSRGADVHQADNEVAASLVMACLKDHWTVVRSNGAYHNVQSKRGTTLFYNASHGGHTEVVD
jgi:ankyrin repeat protein